MTLASLATAAMVAHAEDEPKVKITGSLDLYYQYDFNRPATGSGLVFRNFDTKNNSFTFSAAQIKFSVAPGDGPVGGTLELLFGPNSDAFLGDDTGSERHIAQAYVSYVKDGLTVDFGKFYTWIGAETANAGNNANYSRGLLFTLAEPLYHVGLRASKQVSGVTVTGAVVNGWNETENSNGQASVGLGLAWAGGPAKFAANFYGGVEGGGNNLASRGFGDGDGYKVSLLNLIGGYQISDSLKAGLAVDLGEAKPTTSTNKFKWSGVAAYLSYKLSEQNSVALRAESFDDEDGFITDGNKSLKSYTLTLACAPSKDVTFLVELRQDSSNRNSFAGKNSTFKDNRTTLGFASIFKF